jgi:hypothetical protein
LREDERDRFARANPFAYYPVVGISRIGGRPHAPQPVEPVDDGERLAGPIVPLHARPGGTIVPLHARGSLVPPVR